MSKLELTPYSTSQGHARVVDCIADQRYSRRDFVRSAVLAALLAAQNPSHGQESEDSYAGGLVFQDIERFQRAHARIRRGASAISAMEWYIGGGTDGLKAYTKTYGLAAVDFAASLANYPKFYARLTDVRKRNRPYEADIARAAHRLRVLVPALPEVPIYFFVGVMGHGATVKEVTTAPEVQGLGVLVPIENLSRSGETEIESARWASLDDLSQLTTHELAHVAQVQYQGLVRYRVIYRERARGTHLAYAIREGGADFLSQLASGRLRARHRYLLEREAELWREFSKLLYQPAGASRGWFSGSGEHPLDRPPQLGYAIGWSMCRLFYHRSSDKAVALREILSANELEDFERIAEPYRQEFS